MSGLSLQPVGAAVGKDVGMVGLGAAGETANDLRQQHVDAPAQVAHAQRQPDRIDADQRLNSRSQVARSRAWLSGQYNSTLPVPEPSSTRMQLEAGADGATDARTATNPLGCGGGASATPSSRARHRLECAHQLCNSLNSTLLAAAHAVAFRPDARYATTCSKHCSSRCRSMSTSPPRRCNGHDVGRFRVGREDGVRGTLTQDGRVPVDNNRIENLMRPWAMGRKAWLFAGSELAGQRAAVVMSLVQSAKLCGHDPWAYLKDVLTRLPMHMNSRIEELLPHLWQPHD